MCFSAVVQQNLDLLARQHKARVDMDLFENLFAPAPQARTSSSPKAWKRISSSQNAAAHRIALHIAAWQATTASKWQIELFQQKTRLADIERKLKVRTTQKAQDDQRIAQQDRWLRTKLADLKRTSRDPTTRAFFLSGMPRCWCASGERVIKPMRYHCRPSGKPRARQPLSRALLRAARQLEGFWKNQFGRRHAYCVVQSFYETWRCTISKSAPCAPAKKRSPCGALQPAGRPTYARGLLWNSWQKPGEPALLPSPPSPTTAAGSGRHRPQPLHRPAQAREPERLAHPGADLAVYYALLDDRERPYYAHELRHKPTARLRTPVVCTMVKLARSS